jgi:hypothetical protein
MLVQLVLLVDEVLDAVKKGLVVHGGLRSCVERSRPAS